jgi:hypothetical protein
VAIDLETATGGAPESCQLVIVRGRRWVVSDVIRSVLPADVTSESDGFGWPHRDGLKWPHFALVGVLVR